MNVSATITTAPRATSYLSQTYESVTTAGFGDVTIVADSPKNKIRPDLLAFPSRQLVFNRNSETMSQDGPYRTFCRALRWLLANHDSDCLAVFQDDVEVAKGLRLWLESCLWPGPVERIGCCSVFSIDPGHGGWERLDLSGEKPLRKPGGGCKTDGACGLVFPRAGAEAFLRESRHDSRTRLDFAVGRWCAETGRDYWIHRPSLVQHKGDVSAINPDAKLRTAPDFCDDLQRLAEWHAETPASGS